MIYILNLLEFFVFTLIFLNTTQKHDKNHIA